MFDPRYFVRFDFVVCETITNIPFYQGKHLNTLFRVLLDPYLKKLSEPGELADFGIQTIPTQNGGPTLFPGDQVGVILVFPSRFKDIVLKIIESLR
ncbi:MAG: hypothetical protein Q7J16_13120, partial [Candidatus Cloacimonadales bacterium]|nr:hypothetical protein [Candidatus Cloacimonadales bacterium]